MIQSGDEEHVRKLENVTWIYGRIVINGTSLSVIDFFEHLEYVAYFKDDEYSIYIINNTGLTSAVYPNLRLVRTTNKNPRVIVFRDNNAQLSFDPAVCFNIRNRQQRN
ncbi:hypothetical protein GCK72_019568 [Caenorhabditis remanei]|uniref:Receptor L-domain domain-containing protein n=1 Tax=Caenorhabditis remanei TaxID=31234 RepID=A0A6A5GEU4_CAERE|nr:hypothetical protein GCK72_019568 [Caenorhabditis remanei]KAF1753012.1 hypothetical protein GCK72_019568 [Caenorhabditis remanei]